MECCQVPPNPPLLQPSSQDNCSSPSQPGGSLLSSLLINAYQCPSCTVGPKTTRSIAGMAQQAPSRSKQPPPSTHWLQKIHDELTFPAARTLLPCQLALSSRAAPQAVTPHPVLQQGDGQPVPGTASTFLFNK